MTDQPAGANATFANSNAATTMVKGLTVAGTYVFNIDVNDGANTSSKQLYLAVYDSNPQPVLGQTGFRIGAPYGLVFGNPSGTTHAVIELPTSSATLQAGISDLANSDFTGRGTWSLVSQPTGGNAGVSSTTYIFVSLRANVTNMTVTGDYLFQINVTNPGHPDLTAQILCTVQPGEFPAGHQLHHRLPGRHDAANEFAAALGGHQRLHQSAAAPLVGRQNRSRRREPLFDHQGTTNTDVGNLNLPGSYTFTLRAFDDLHMTTQDKTITVAAAAGAPVIISAAFASVIAGTPFTYIVTASGSPTGFGALNLPLGLAFSNGVISGRAGDRWNL